MPKNEWKNPKIKAALDKEWDKLRCHPHPTGKGKGVWDETRVRESSAVRAEARTRGATYHFGRIVELCYEKSSELPANHPDRKFKGRSVVLGDNIRDQDHHSGISEELGSPPPYDSGRPRDRRR